MFSKHYFFIFITCLVSFSLSCSGPQKELRAYIEPNPHWKMVEACGYEGCRPMVDFLKGKDVTFRVEFDRDNEKQFFIVQTMFTSVSNEFEFNPSNITIMLKNEETLRPKVFTCSHTIWDLHYLRSNSPLQGPVSIKELDCFLLFFDHPAPEVGEELMMNINEALTENGRSIGIPLIHFRKNIVMGK